MNMKMLFLAGGISAGLFGNVELPDIFSEKLPPMVVHQYSERGETSKKVGLADEEYKVISRFLEKNRLGWSYDFRSYAPKYLLKGPNFSINCMSDGVVINYQNEKGEWKQISKSTDISFCGLYQKK